MPSTQQQIEVWKARLLDLSRRNRLIHMRPGMSGTVSVLQPSADQIFDSLVRQQRHVPFAAPLSLEQRLAALSWNAPATGATIRLDRMPAPPKPGQFVTDLQPEQQERALYTMRLRARNAITEQGVNILFLALGVLEWFAPALPEEVVRSPLVLLPVELQRAPLGAEYTVRLLDDEIVLNPTLAHKLRQDAGIQLPALPEERDEIQFEQLFEQISALVSARDGWRVLPEATLGLFSFLKLLMYHDLERAATVATNHPLLARLAGDAANDLGAAPTPPAPAAEPPRGALDARPPQDCYQVLDADASQAEAIAAARAGESFVLQGPPGTGKSQTITNIIAECLAQGKRVLFVSEKMAALEVVYERLRQCGLAEFCLEAHSHKASKRTVLDALGATLQDDLPVATVDFPYAELARVRDDLNRYAAALHTPYGALGWTAQHVYAQIARLADAPDSDAPLGEITHYTSDQLGSIDALLTQLDARRSVLAGLPANPWRDCAITLSSFEQRGRIRSHLRALLNALDDLPPVAAALALPLGMPVPDSFTAVRALADLGVLLQEPASAPVTWLQPVPAAIRSARHALIAEARQHYAALIDSEARLAQRHRAALLDLDVEGMFARFQGEYSSWTRMMRPHYHQDMAALRASLQANAPFDYAHACADLELATQVRAERRWEAEHLPALHQLAPLYDGRATDWDALARSADWADRVLALPLVDPLPTQLQAAASAPMAERTMLLEAASWFHAALGQLDNEIAFYATLFPPPALPPNPFAAARAHVELLLERMGGLDDWWTFCELRRTAEPLGIAPFLDSYRSASLPPDTSLVQPRRSFYKRLYQLWLDTAVAQLPALRDFHRVHHEALIVRFCQLDSAQLGATQTRLRQMLAARRPSPTVAAMTGGELATLRRELHKQRRHKPIRQLLREIPHLVGQLKPCMLMSPLSVSQFLDPEAAPFDLVIFDEASQIRTEDAAGAIMRGKALIVVGDNRQLPPTSFFVTGGDEEAFDSEETDAANETPDSFESVLDACTASGLPVRMLRWHYRSRDEALITFSNTHFYNGRLATFPVAHTTPGYGVRLEYVADGVYDRQGTRANVIEARRVADLVVAHLDESSTRSLGVVAFNQPQQLAILHELERRRAEDDRLAVLFDEERPEAFFVKNLENVQGDERDVMLISVGYGRDASGRLLMTFGPLNQQGGERRLNVAITRAREQVVVVSSLQPEDIDVRRTQNPGPKLLRAYLEYVRQNGLAQGAASGFEAVDVVSCAPHSAQVSHRFEDDLAATLAASGLTLRREIGHSDFRIDIAIYDPNDPQVALLGVECDGDDYRDAPTARDRERLREQVLAKLGWRIHRAWSAEWARDAEAEIARVLAALRDEASQTEHREVVNDQ